MISCSDINIIPLNRRQRRFWKTLAIFTAFWMLLTIYNGGLVHLENGPHHMHVGLGAVHRDGREVHIGVSESWSERLKGPLEASDPRVLETLRKKYLHPPSEMPYNINNYKGKLNYKDMDSWKFLHQHILRLFGDYSPGFFIEAGALDGEYLSNTLHLEAEYGWSGLLIEPNPISFHELVKKNRRSWSSNSCLAVTSYPKEMVLEMVDTSKDSATSMAQWVLRGSSFLSKEGGHDQQYQATHFLTTYSVAQCFPFSSYMKALNVSKVDLFSLDVEGAEIKVLNTIPWDEIEISVLLLEHHGINKGKDVSFTKKIEDLGYNLYDYNIDKDNIGDYIFVKRGFIK